MKEEAGITENSLDNASELRILHGWDIAKVDFVANTKENDYFVTVWWTTGVKFTFTGFSWGYTGTGPTGLDRMLEMFELKDKISADVLPVDKFGKTCATLFVNQQPHG